MSVYRSAALAALVLSTLQAMALPAAAAPARWFIVMGSFPQGSPAIEDSVYRITNQCRLAAKRGEGFDFQGMTSDLSFTYLGPFATKAAAEGRLTVARQCVPGAYLKSATPIARGGN